MAAGNVLHGQGGQPGETVGPGLHHLADFIVALSGGGSGDVGVEVVVVETAEGGNDVNIHAEGVHVGEALFRGPSGLGRQLTEPFTVSGHQDLAAAGVLVAPEGMPCPSRFGGAPEALGRQVGVDVDAAHVGLLLAGAVGGLGEPPGLGMIPRHGWVGTAQRCAVGAGPLAAGDVGEPPELGNGGCVAGGAWWLRWRCLLVNWLGWLGVGGWLDDWR